MSDKILFVGTDKKYFFAEKDRENLNLKPSKKSIFAGDVVSYGFTFNFKDSFEKKNKGKSPSNDRYGRLARQFDGTLDLDTMVRRLELMVEDVKADYILVDELRCSDRGTSWDIEGKAQLLIKR